MKIRLSKQQAKELLSTVGDYKISHLKKMGSFRLGAGFRLIARMTGCCVNYYLVDVNDTKARFLLWLSSGLKKVDNSVTV